MKSSFWERRFAKLLEVDIELELDIVGDEYHVISVFEKANGTRLRVTDPVELWSYGKTFERRGRRCCLSYAAIETLQTLRSMNPEIRDDGCLQLEFLPPALAYLRHRGDVAESDESAQIKLSKTPLEPSAVVDFEPGEGITVSAGFRTPDDSVVKQSDLRITRDGGYARFGKVFHPLKRRIAESAREWIEREEAKVALDDVPEFFLRDLVLLKSDLSAVLTDRALRVQVVTTPLKPRVTVHRNEPGWLDFVVDYETGGFVVPEGAVSGAASRRESYIQYEEYSFLPLDPEVVQQTERAIEELGATPLVDRYRIPITRFSSLEEFIDRIGGVRVLSEEYQKFLAQLTGFEPDNAFALSEDAEQSLRNAGLELRPYQRAGIHWLDWLRQNHLHGILADDMGLGKTVQAICAINIAHEQQAVDRPSLIICPKSVVPFWVKEVRRAVPRIQIHPYGGTGRDRTIWDRAGKCWLVTTYETLARDIEFVSRVPFYYVVLDEATKIKNPDAQRTQAIKSINAMHRLALSGTPVENRLTELWSIFDFLIKGLFGTQSRFSSKYEVPITSGDGAMAEELARRIRPFLLRRLKEDVADDIPEKLEHEEWCDLTEEQRSLYGQIQDTMAKPLREEIEAGLRINYQMNVLPILTKLKQVCDHPALISGNAEPLYGRSEKFDTTMDLIREIRAAGEQVIVFSHFLRTLDLFELGLHQEGISYIRIDGSVDNRQPLIDTFNSRCAAVALCSIQACGYGITLTAANHVIHFDRWWNPAVEDQATDRVHRIGQQKTVYVYRTLVSGTLEEKIALLLERKRGLADRVVGAAIDQPLSWTKEELLELLKPLE